MCVVTSFGDYLPSVDGVDKEKRGVGVRHVFSTAGRLVPELI